MTHGNQELLRIARAAWQRGDAANAEAQCRSLLVAEPRNAAAWTLLGIVRRRSDPTGAEAALLRALDCEPSNADAAFHLGNLYREQQKQDQAIAAYRRALNAAPDHPSLLNNLALAYDASGDRDRALEGYRAVLQRDSSHRQALGNLAHLLCRMHRYDEAAAAAAQFLRRFPEGDTRLWIDYGICQHYQGDYDAAEASFQQALAKTPDDVTALTNLGSVLIDRENYERADVVLTRAIAAGASSAYSVSLLAYCRASLCAWSGLDALHERIRALLAAGDDVINAFVALSLPLSAEEQLRVARRWAADLAPPATAAAPVASSIGASRTQPTLRVGYVSSDFRSHPTTFLLAEVWERHDRNRFETFAYSIGPNEASALRSRVEAAFDHFRDCAGDSVERTSDRIRDDGIDLLIDLNGYTTHARSEIFAARPAPIQLQWLGHLGTLGADHIDYVVTDRVATPPDQQPYFTERLLYLPDCYCPSDTRRAVASSESTTRAQNGLPEQGFVFCCFNQEYKIRPALFDVWMRLLNRIAGSVMWLSPARGATIDNLRREAVARGVDPARLVWASRVDLGRHLARLIHADLFLDTLPYNAGATANDALWMGVPVLTCVGTTMAGRAAASQLLAIGLDDMLTVTLEEYEAKALQLAFEPSVMAEVRQRLSVNRATHPLFDMQRFTRNLEDAFARAWATRMKRNATGASVEN